MKKFYQRKKIRREIQISTAAILLFGKNPQNFFPRARIRFIRYEGTEEKFVKEFGEGVNRMCNELEQVGLKNPVYHTNAFMLQAVIYNSKVGKTIIEKTADSLKKLAVAVNKSLIDYQ